MFSRRELLKCLAAGGAIVAGELWIPGAKIISIPKPVFNAAGDIVWDSPTISGRGHWVIYDTFMKALADGHYDVPATGLINISFDGAVIKTVIRSF